MLWARSSAAVLLLLACRPKTPSKTRPDQTRPGNRKPVRVSNTGRHLSVRANYNTRTTHDMRAKTACKINFNGAKNTTTTTRNAGERLSEGLYLSLTWRVVSQQESLQLHLLVGSTAVSSNSAGKRALEPALLFFGDEPLRRGRKIHREGSLNKQQPELTTTKESTRVSQGRIERGGGEGRRRVRRKRAWVKLRSGSNRS